MNSELKPCPFCGRKDPVVKILDGGSVMIECPNCGANQGVYSGDTRLDWAISSWNSRINMEENKDVHPTDL